MENIKMANINKVLYNIDQRNDTTSSEKQTARLNIGAVGADEVLTADKFRWDSATPTNVETIHFNQKSVSTAQIVADTTDLGSTVPLPSLATDEGKVPVAYYRDGRGYFLLEQYKDPRFPDSSSSDYTKVLTVDSRGQAVWQTPVVGASDYGVYELSVTKVLNGTGTELWDGEGLTDANISESYTNCTAATCPVSVGLNSYGGLRVYLDNSYGSITCESHTYVSSNANFATELGMWGYDGLCQMVAGMNRTWYVTDGSNLDQNGIRTTTETLKSGTLTIKFDFVFQV